MRPRRRKDPHSQGGRRGSKTRLSPTVNIGIVPFLFVVVVFRSSSLLLLLLWLLGMMFLPPHYPLPPLSPINVIILIFASLALLHCLFSLSAAATFSLSAAATPHFFRLVAQSAPHQ